MWSKIECFQSNQMFFVNANNSSSLRSEQEGNDQLKRTKHKLKLDTSSVNI